MSTSSCLFGRATPELAGALKADPIGRVHRFERCEGVAPSEHALLVVHLCGAIAPPWTEDEPRPPRWPSWGDETWPPSAVLARWAAIAERQPLAWWWWWERGDSLYADACWLLGDGKDELLTRETYLVRDTDTDVMTLHPANGAPVEQATARAPFALALAHVGFEATLQYFAPAESHHFDWSPFRL